MGTESPSRSITYAPALSPSKRNSPVLVPVVSPATFPLMRSRITKRGYGTGWSWSVQTNPTIRTNEAMRGAESILETFKASASVATFWARFCGPEPWPSAVAPPRPTRAATVNTAVLCLFMRVPFPMASTSIHGRFKSLRKYVTHLYDDICSDQPRPVAGPDDCTSEGHRDILGQPATAQSVIGWARYSRWRGHRHRPRRTPWRAAGSCRTGRRVVRSAMGDNSYGSARSRAPARGPVE